MVESRGRALLVVHAPLVDTEDLPPDSASGLVRAARVAPAVLIDGRPVDPHPERGAATRYEVPVRPGPHRVEVMCKQSYETVRVQAPADRATHLHVHYRRHRYGDDTLLVGPKAYIDTVLASRRTPLGGALRWGCGLWFTAFFVLAVAVGVGAQTLGLGPGRAVALALGAATVIALVGASVAAIGARGRSRTDPVPRAPDPIRLGDARLLPSAVPPPSGPGIVLRMRPRQRALAVIGFPGRMRDRLRRSYYEFYFNELIDWVSAPRVSLDGVELGAAWGTWWIPADPGPHRLRVVIDGMGGVEGIGFDQTTDVTVPAGSPALLTARCNVIELARRRRERRGDLVSRWQRIMRRAGRYEDMSEQARAEPGLEFEN